MSMPHNPAAAPAERGQCQAIDLIQKIDSIDGHWEPRVVAEMNDYQFKVVKVQGEFPWHVHAETDETFVVLEVAQVKMLLIEPRGVVNTGDGASGPRTVQNDQWI
ncbi:MAG: cupin domain-containing protein [Acidovorax sp.]|nr:MAG: cupin domain-containing protein [Acidovorax sp.]